MVFRCIWKESLLLREYRVLRCSPKKFVLRIWPVYRDGRLSAAHCRLYLQRDYSRI